MVNDLAMAHRHSSWPGIGRVPVAARVADVVGQEGQLRWLWLQILFGHFARCFRDDDSGRAIEVAVAKSCGRIMTD